ncbi:THO complex subunit 5B isoform X2 [Phalaenopsis equestris]|nr:THO complex subunit 5B isoform X2 [Phalaenopsis equestris]
MEAGEMEAEPAIVKTAHDALDEICRAVEEIAAKILLIKKEGRPKSELRELNTQMALLFITLRQLNRTILVEEDHIKAETESAKAPVDFTTLQLHNLMYEKNHYLKAIKTCRDFRSKYPDIELVPEEEFFTNAPEDIKAKVLASEPAHNLMLKRLNYELFQRKELCKLHEKLELHKKGLVETIGSRKKFLSSLPSHLKSLKKATLPVQQQLGILHTKKLKQHYAAELLPPPLYIVYSQLMAQKEAFGEKIEMEITGSVKDAQTFSQQQASKENGTPSNMENIRLEDDAPDEEDDVQRRRKRPKKNLPKDNGDQGGILQTHPLKVIVRVFEDEDLQAKPLKLMSLKFEYLIKLNVVCVGVEDQEQLSDENILCNLFPNDTGTELPHQTAKLYAGDFLFFGDRSSSRPYMWAQHLAGMDFLPELPPLQRRSEDLKYELRSANISSGLSLYRHENRVQTVLQRIRSRKKAQLALM